MPEEKTNAWEMADLIGLGINLLLGTSALDGGLRGQEERILQWAQV